MRSTAAMEIAPEAVAFAPVAGLVGSFFGAGIKRR
jgi:hypothetical protein